MRQKPSEHRIPKGLANINKYILMIDIAFTIINQVCWNSLFRERSTSIWMEWSHRRSRWKLPCCCCMSLLLFIVSSSHLMMYLTSHMLSRKSIAAWKKNWNTHSSSFFVIARVTLFSVENEKWLFHLAPPAFFLVDRVCLNPSLTFSKHLL